MEKYIENFLEDVSKQLKEIHWEEVALAIKLLQSAYDYDGRIYVLGNGGSAAIASHFANDLNKTVFGYKGEKKMKRFQAVCLADSVPSLTAWANDVDFESVFSEQLKNFAQEKDVLLAISSSGNSPNIVKALETAKNLHLSIIGFSGFDGGKLMGSSDAKIHINSSRYEIVESCHQTICHLIINYFSELF